MTATKKSFPPLVGEAPGILILGTLPGERSLQAREYYAHPANRFWPLVARLLNEGPPTTYDQKKRLLTDHGIALWDVAHSADRTGSSDAKIKNETPNDIPDFLRLHPTIHTIAFNGKGAERLFTRYFRDRINGVRSVTLLSTSPANCQYGDAEMIGSWSRII